MLLPFSFLSIVLGAATPLHKRDAPAGATIVQYFEANWDSIAAECMTFLGPNGYTYVQVSPPTETVPGSQWWTSYQPVSYEFGSKRGSRSSFQNMVTTCRNAGVKVITDTIWNHMSNSGSGTGTGGNSFSKYYYPSVPYSDNGDFHHCGLTTSGSIEDYTNKTQVQTCELSGLADLATETENVRAKLAAYANDLFSMGVSGLRLDAAKHIAASDISNIVSRLSPQPEYITSEVIYGENEAVQPSEYTSIGSVQEFRYSSTLRDAFRNNMISALSGIPFSGWVPSASANVFVTNHDLERNGGSLTVSDGALYTLGFVFSLAHPYGTPTILSGYNFTDPNTGAPNNLYATCSENGGMNGWRCEHRWIQISNMVAFRKSVVTTGMSAWQYGTNNQIAFSRGNVGFVAINNEPSTIWCSNFNVSLPDGNYKDLYSNSETISVSSGIASISIPSRSAIAIYTGSAVNTPASATNCGTITPTITFSVYAETIIGQNIYVAGSTPELGNWDPNSSLACSSSNYPIWTCSIQISSGTRMEYKYIKLQGSTTIWETGDNRVYTVSTSSTLNDTWRN